MFNGCSHVCLEMFSVERSRVHVWLSECMSGTVRKRGVEVVRLQAAKWVNPVSAMVDNGDLPNTSGHQVAVPRRQIFSVSILYCVFVLLP